MGQFPSVDLCTKDHLNGDGLLQSQQKLTREKREKNKINSKDDSNIEKMKTNNDSSGDFSDNCGSFISVELFTCTDNKQKQQNKRKQKNTIHNKKMEPLINVSELKTNSITKELTLQNNEYSVKD